MGNVRGDIRITMGGKEWTLRPSFSALQDIEDRSGSGLVEIALKASQGKLRCTDIAIVVWAGIRGAKTPSAPDLDAVGEMILADEGGFVSFFPTIRDFLVEVLRTGPKQQEGTPSGNGLTGTVSL